MSAGRVLVVDDEPPIRRLLKAGLGTQGYEVIEAADGATARVAMAEERPDGVILDLGLPDIGGEALLEGWRRSGVTVPILILSSRTGEAGIVKALDAGADDYVTKPFGIDELVARLRVALRHRVQAEGAAPVFRTGGLSVDLVRRIVRLDGAEIHLSPKEYEILALLARHAGKVITHQQLMKAVWGGAIDAQQLRVYVRQVRQKLKDDPARPFYIRTETGVGYRLREAD
ncbi:response regulator transcription factor [Kaistia geumhonensis]|uniref:Two-component system KDP operon response regulator KdpE n=1 Tax=Kaistia geumhonensis TaxID=410839 RepID=A0ABU0M6E9_9HYPH|nr:response regulator transcription factor [Kaistia geumhonensis]MCX5478246.1 response regulator transcription factor [Kaistia geumhonensis]MDQ0516537.1 two-component system KDP operon response regulator KdpE [Kaistia geumhonensis]